MSTLGGLPVVGQSLPLEPLGLLHAHRDQKKKTPFRF
jgi:hypothetical protein